MRDYLEVRRKFSREALERELLVGSLDTGVNACFECCDRWSEEGRIALEWVGRDGARESVTFAALRDNAIRCANMLARRGIARGDVVAGLLPRIPELLTVMLATWRIGAIYQPLFTAFGPRAIEQRVTAAGGSRAKLIVADADNTAKLAEVTDCPPVLVIGHGGPGAHDFAEALAGQPTRFDPIMLRGGDPFILIFTSGTTGPPKGVLYPLSFLLPVAVYMRDGLDLRPSDRFWNIADPGWGYGMMYTVLGPLLLGSATTMYEGSFSVESTLDIVAKLGITNMAAAPAAYRMLMAAGDAAMAPIAGRLRVASSLVRFLFAVLCSGADGSCARLRFRAAIKSITGDGVDTADPGR
jgi:acetyl-CoA synthetase